MSIDMFDGEKNKIQIRERRRDSLNALFEDAWANERMLSITVRDLGINPNLPLNELQGFADTEAEPAFQALLNDLIQARKNVKRLALMHSRVHQRIQNGARS